MTDNKNKVDSQLITGQESLRVFEGLNRGMSRRDALRMLGLAGVAMAGAGSLFGSAGQVFASTAGSPAKGKRGVMGFVLSTGLVKIGDTVLVYPPVQ